MAASNSVKFGIVRYFNYSGDLEVVSSERLFFYEDGSLIPFNNNWNPYIWYYVRSPCDDINCTKQDAHFHNYKANLLHISGE